MLEFATLNLESIMCSVNPGLAGFPGFHGVADLVAVLSIALDFWPVATGIVLAVACLILGLRYGGRRAARANEELLGQADCQLWKAVVEREASGPLKWTFAMQPSALFAGLFGGASLLDVHHPWRHVETGARQAMDARSREAIESGAPGYSQEFPIVKGGVTRWLQEHVNIRRAGHERWIVVGVITDVTVLRSSEERLRARDTLVIQTLARADCLLWRASVKVDHGRVSWLGFDMPTSALYRRLFGDRDQREYGARLWSLLDVPDLPAMNERSTRAILSGETGYEQEFRALRGPEMFWLHEQVSIAPVAPGELQLVGVIMDVTATRSAIEARKAAEAQMEQLLAHADCLLWQARVFRVEDGELRWVLFVPRSSLHRKIFGHDPEDPPRMRWHTVMPPEESAAVADRGRDAIVAGASGYEQEIRARRDGVTTWLREQVTIQRVGDHEWYLVGVIFDVTGLRQAEADLAAEKERLDVTLAAMADAVITTDRDGAIQFANRAAAQLLRLDPSSVVGRNVNDVCRFSLENGSPIAVPLVDIVSKDATVALPPHTRVAAGPSVLVPVEGVGTPVHGPSGSAAGIVLVLRDVTERERLELEITRASKLQSVGVLAGGIAHDFNNLLTVVMGNVVVARQSSPLEGDVAACLLDAERAVLRAKDLTQQLLTFARGGDPVRTAVRLPEIVMEAAAFGVHGSSVRCEFDMPDDLWMANVDRGQIGQVVQNLVINAVQAMPNGGIVQVSARNEPVVNGSAPVSDGDYVRITVRDSGCGIPVEQLARIFDPYFTTKTQGSGLGLATAYSIMKKHRGAIDVSSQPGVGSTFRLFLPALREGVAAQSPAPAAAPKRLQGRILFMDDEEPIRKIGGRMLSRIGLSVETAADGAEALARYRAAIDVGRPFDVVMLDLTVPGGMGGLEAFQKMRELDPGVRGVVSSGYSSDPVLGDFQAYGFVGMIAKPYRMDECAQALAEVLARPRVDAGR